MATDPVETEILRRLTPSQKLAVMQGLWRQAWDLKVAGLRRQHPSWSPEQVNVRVREIFQGAGT